MGTYDTVGKLELQIKCVPDGNILKHYNVDNMIDLEDGLYICWSGWFVVEGGKIVVSGNKVFDKWGNKLDCDDFIRKNSVIAQAVGSVHADGSLR